MQAADLPIFAIRQRLLAACAKQKRIVLTAPTGSGKSTQVPQMLLDGGLLGDGQVVILQPRRIATRLLATWVAQTRGGKLGAEVGYQMRLDNKMSAATRICYQTEGILLRRMVTDPRLNGIRAIVFDEFHERHLYGDITLARALEIQAGARPDLLILVMSATLDAGAVEKYLQPCDVLASEGRAYPVTIEYLPHSQSGQPIWDVAVRETQRLIREQPAGDALIFMPGAYEIQRTVAAAQAALGKEFVVLPLHGELPPRDQDAAVARHERRKVVVATNVAETSLTIDGVRLVIDSGLARIPRFDPYRGINTLLIEKISRASADQRAGRAGRTAPGHCVRLWTEHEHSGRAMQELPEVKRLDLAEVMLALKASGVVDLANFRWLEPPEQRALERAETLLADLGAIDDSGAITAIGQRMLAFPTHPRYARMFLAAAEYGCVRSIALVAALTQGRDLLMHRGDQLDREKQEELLGAETESDIFVLMNAWRYAEECNFALDRCRRVGINAQAARQVRPLFEQFLAIASAQGLDVTEKTSEREAIQRCLLVGFADHLAKRVDDRSLRCELIHGRGGTLARESVVRAAPLFVVGEIREIESGGRRERNLNVTLNLATAVSEEWLRTMYPDGFHDESIVIFDSALKRVVTRKQTKFRDLVLGETQLNQAPADEAASILAQEVVAGRCVLEHWDDGVEQWIMRVNLLTEWMPELELPKIGEQDRAAIFEHICHGAFSYGAIRGRPVMPVVKSWLSRQQQQWVEDYAPERIVLPRGRKVKIAYTADAPPTIAARIQDLYGINDILRIADRRVALRIEILAPSNRPVQVTDNMATFWRDTYPQLKPQLQRRYPKHEWR